MRPGPDATLADDLWPEDLPRLLGLLERADLYLQDEVEVALHPTLTRAWSRTDRAGQRLVQAPGTNRKQYGFGLVDWRDGHLDWQVADGRRAAPLCAQLRRAVARSRGRGRIAMVILDNLGIHTPKGSRLLRGLLEELGEDLVLVYTPTYDPDANRIEGLWRSVTHTHQRQTLVELVADADRWAHTITPAKVLGQIGSPFAPDQQLPSGRNSIMQHEPPGSIFSNFGCYRGYNPLYLLTCFGRRRGEMTAWRGGGDGPAASSGGCVLRRRTTWSLKRDHRARGGTMAEPALYERLGGVYAISAVVDYFSDQLIQRDTIEGENPYIKDWNAKKAAYRLPGLKFLRTLWVCAIAGGPFQYTGKPLGDAHFDFQLTPAEFDQVSAVLADALDHFKVPPSEKEEVLAAFEAYKPAVTAGSILR